MYDGRRYFGLKSGAPVWLLAALKVVWYDLQKGKRQTESG
jgi:hypothetical protein